MPRRPHCVSARRRPVSIGENITRHEVAQAAAQRGAAFQFSGPEKQTLAASDLLGRAENIGGAVLPVAIRRHHATVAAKAIEEVGQAGFERATFAHVFLVA